MAGERGLQRVLRVLGVVPVVMGAYGLVTGTRGIVGAGAPDPSVDSEYRFMSSWYIGGGLLALRAARQPAVERDRVRTLSALLLGSALGRALSLLRVGRPHPVHLVLMLVELAIPAVLLPWQRAVERAERARRPGWTHGCVDGCS